LIKTFLKALRDKLVPGKKWYLVTRLDKSASGVILFAKFTSILIYFINFFFVKKQRKKGRIDGTF